MNKKDKNKTLHIYIDESGNFEKFGKDGGSRYYIVCFVLSERITYEKEKNKLFINLHKINSDIELVHCSPLIRQKDEYINYSLLDRIKILNIFISFVKTLDIKSIVCISNKNNFNTFESLQQDIISNIKSSIKANFSYFSKFTNIVIHYDNGQEELTDILRLVFNDLLRNFSFDFKEYMKNQILIQVADVIATICSINEKYKYSKTNSREREFFKSETNFINHYYKNIEKILKK